MEDPVGGLVVRPENDITPFGYPGKTLLPLGNRVFRGIRQVIGQIKTSNVDRVVRRIEDLYPWAVLPEIVNIIRIVVDQNFVDPEVGRTLCLPRQGG